MKFLDRFKPRGPQKPEPKPELKSPREIGLMREAGLLVAEALRLCRSMAKPGVKTVEIDKAVEDLYASRGAVPLFKGYPGQGPVPGRDVHLPQRTGGPRHPRPAGRSAKATC